MCGFCQTQEGRGKSCPEEDRILRFDRHTWDRLFNHGELTNGEAKAILVRAKRESDHKHEETKRQKPRRLNNFFEEVDAKVLQMEMRYDGKIVQSQQFIEPYEESQIDHLLQAMRATTQQMIAKFFSIPDHLLDMPVVTSKRDIGFGGGPGMYGLPRREYFDDRFRSGGSIDAFMQPLIINEQTHNTKEKQMTELQASADRVKTLSDKLTSLEAYQDKGFDRGVHFGTVANGYTTFDAKACGVDPKVVAEFAATVNDGIKKQIAIELQTMAKLIGPTK